MTTDIAKGIALLRTPFPPNQISRLPKPTKAQTDEVKADYTKGIRCHECGAWHHPKVVHLDYVGHAALTDRLLDADPAWSWEPMAVGQDGTPVIDAHGGMWIRLTVCGVSRLGYGQASKKANDADSAGNAIKECIGDALRNAAMRFGAALELWHKGDLHAPEDDDGNAAAKAKPRSVAATYAEQAMINAKRMAELEEVALYMIDSHKAGKDSDAIRVWYAADTFESNDERTHVWGLLGAESKLRSTIKANKPTKEAS